MRLTRDTVTTGLILAVAGFLWHQTTLFDTDPLGMNSGMPATYMPRLVLAIIVLLTALMLVQSLISGKGETIGNVPPWQVGATAILLAVSALLFTKLGVPLVFFGVCFAMPVLWGARNYRAIALFAVSIPVVIYIVFKLLLGLRLPMGPLSSIGL